ncbi:MAG: hypothetical protein KBT49_03545 [Bacteroidetes bacterium]|nr:hypothetical protein [Candidatus Colenecus caballi]
MKKILALASILTVLASSCRKEAVPEVYYNEVMKLAYDTYAGQFDFIWKNISTGYVFWDIDTTNWDRVYDECMPQLMALDNQVNQGQSIQDSVLLGIYQTAMGQMTDHHMSVAIKNLHPAPGNVGHIQVRPGIIAMNKRPEYIEPRLLALLRLLDFQENIEREFSADKDIKIIEHQFITVETPENVNYGYNLFQLPDGRLVPYLWQSAATLSPVFEYMGEDNEAGRAAAVLDHFFSLISTTPREKLAGIILDNRVNAGGWQDDLDYLIGSYINEEVTMFQTRYKEGPGRLEHSVWTDYKQKPLAKYHRDITKENIPFIILIDLASISMGEIEPICARALLPTAYIIGETSFGATGPLQSELVDLNYGGSFGNSDLSTGHYVYTSDFESRVGGTNYEGKGIVPDLEVIRKDHGGSFKAAIDAALKYAGER